MASLELSRLDGSGRAPRHHALIVAYYFPPLGGIGSVRVRSFASYLPESGWDVTVLAPRNGAYYRDPELHFPEERVLRTPVLELSRLGKRLVRSGGDDVRPAQLEGLRASLRSFSRAALYFPDAQVGWYVPAIFSARWALRGQRFDLVFSSSFPITAHLIARQLHRWLRVPWVAEFRDPWSQALAPGSRTAGRALRLERSLAQDASALVMTSPSWAAHHSRLWGRPVTVIPNGHDGPGAAESPASTDQAASTGFTLGFLGSFYPATQRLTAVWEAVRRLNRDRGGEIDRMLFVGDIHPALGAELAERGLTPLLETTGFLPHRRALARIADATALLIPGPADGTGIHRGQVSAKLAECLATGLPIIYVGEPDCDAADLLRGHDGCHVVAVDDVEGVARALASSRRGVHERDLPELGRPALTRRLADLFEHVLATTGSPLGRT